MNDRTEIEGVASRIFAAIELSQSAWIVALHVPCQDKISLHRVASGDVDRLLVLFERARQTARAASAAEASAPDPQICCCYEAGFDGFWLHRWLVARGISNQVLDSASIQVSRRKRHVKTDRIDAEGLVRVLMAWHRGESKACSVVHVPTPEEEDAKRLHRARENLLRERVRHVNRIKGLLTLHGVRHIEPMRQGWITALGELETRDGRSFPPRLMAEIRREAKLLELVKKLLVEVTTEIEALVRSSTPAKGRRKAPPHPVASRLIQLRGIGPIFASVLATEVFYRRFTNRRAVASYVGLTPTPYSSGATHRDQGISKAGNSRGRHHAVELAWLWLRNQPASRLTAWFLERVSTGKSRVRRIAIVALARKLIVALWRYLETGLVPEGAVLKA